MTRWVATSFGALDLTGTEYASEGFEIVALPATPGQPVFLMGDGAAVWRRLVDGPVADEEISDVEREIIDGLIEMGLASSEMNHRGVFTALHTPWLTSVFHELVYALVACVAAQEGIDLFFIKGPTLHAQGLRSRQHSGDVDCWVRPGDDRRLGRAMASWGWTPLLLPFTGTTVTHSLTLVAGAWGCAIDVHSSYPGIGISPEEAFDALYGGSEARVFAGLSARTPNLAEHAVLAALHDMRPYEGVLPNETAIARVVTILRRAEEPVLTAVDRLDAGYVLQWPLERAFGPHARQYESSRPPRDWSMRLEPSTSVRHFRALRLVPLLQRPRILFRLIWPHYETMRVALDDRSASRGVVFRARMRRVGVSVRKLIARR